MESQLLKWIYPTMVWIGLGILSHFPVEKDFIQNLKQSHWGNQWRATASVVAAAPSVKKEFIMTEREKNSDSNAADQDESQKPVVISPDRDL